MPTESVELAVGDERYPGRLNVPVEDTDRGVVVLPGAGHGPYGDVFDRFAGAAADRGIPALRYESWTDDEELGEKTLTDLHREVDAAVELLQDRGCSHVAVVAKSFGGAIALTYVPGAVERVVLWAPAALVGEQFGMEPNVETLETTALADAEEEGIVIDTADLTGIDVPVRVLHGDEDALPMENSRAIVEAIPDAELVEIEGADHSFSGDDVEAETVERTLEFLP